MEPFTFKMKKEKEYQSVVKYINLSGVLPDGALSEIWLRRMTLETYMPKVIEITVKEAE